MTFMVLLAACSSDGDRAKTTSYWDGPLIAASNAGAGQNYAKPGQLIVLLSTVTLINRSAEPVTVVGLAEWEPIGLHLAEAELTYGKRFGNGGGGPPNASAYERAMNTADPQWEWVKPLLGATIGPNYGGYYTLALGFRVAEGYRAGTIRGIVLTYRTESGATYRVRVPVLTSYCTTGKVDEPGRCKEIDRRSEDLFTVDKPLRSPTERELKQAGTWERDDG